jgi:hypothetical protein
MQEGGATQGSRIRQGLGPLGGVEHQLNAAILDGIHDMRPTFQYFVHAGRGDTVARKEKLRPVGSHNGKAEICQHANGIEDAKLVALLYRNEDCAALGHGGAGAELALGESHGKVAVEADNLPGRAHFRSE